MLFDVAILINPYANPDMWKGLFAELLPDETLWYWPECPDPAEVEMLIAWRMRRDDLATFTNLTHILSMGAGTEQWQKDGSPEATIVRLSDPNMSDEMAAYAVHWVTHFQRGFDVRFGADALDSWGSRDVPTPPEFPVGVLGFGSIGARVGQAFLDLGYPVNAWSRRGTDTPGVTSYAGTDELAAFLGASRAVVNVLPDTESTRGLLDAERFAQFGGAVFVNIGRGTVIASENDLVASVESGDVGAAVLDVTSPEPPDAASPLFGHDRIVITPHIAGTTQPRSAAALIAANVDRIRAGENPFPVVDPAAGY